MKSKIWREKAEGMQPAPEKGTGEGVTRWERKGDCRDLGSQWWAGDSGKRRNRLRPKGWGKACVRAGAVDKGLGVGLGSDFGLT